jgi:NAD(P)-dependent dehydrogenase (short-subunit alcohol dehydrogenase family)
MGILDSFRLKGKVAVVTGGGRGLGLAMAEGLAEAGSDVVLCSRKEAACREAADRVRELGVRSAGFRCDVTNQQEVEKLRDFALKEFGRVDILVNNAGASWGAPMESYPLSGWKKVIDVNVTGTFLCSQILGKVMIERGEGKIVNVSSIYGGIGVRPEAMDAIAYNTSKGAIDAFTRDLAVKWAAKNIHVNAIAPAFVETDMSRVTMEKGGEVILSHVPMGRFGQPNDLKGAVVFLSSKASDYITGTILCVDGGYRAV